MTGALFPGIGSEREDMLLLLKENFNSRWVKSAYNEINVQEGIYAVSASLWEDSKSSYHVNLMAGHSLGFYSALYASGSIDFETGFYLITTAHKAINKVIDKGRFGMTAIIGIKWDIIENLCRDFKDIYVANINSATQVVISGNIDSLEEFENKMHNDGALKVLRLAIRYPLHTPFLQGTADLMAEAIKDVEVKPPSIPVVDHTTGTILTSAEQIRNTLTGQFTKKVIWRDVIQNMWQCGVRKFIEVGPGNVLSKITQWIERDAEVIALDVQVR